MDVEQDTEPMFRSAKRRKFYRKRTDDDDGSSDEHTARPDQPAALRPGSHPAQDASSATDNVESTKLSVAEIMRLRRQGRGRRGGIEFTPAADQTHQTAGPHSSQAPGTIISKDESPEELAAVANRFAPQTGQVADVNKHMMAFIDAEIAKRRQGIDSKAQSADGGQTQSVVAANMANDIDRQPAALGKLHEIDLGVNATLTNIARTEAAQRRLDGEPEDSSTAPSQRLGRDGKPWRGRKSRTSEDVKRDKLVEEVLRESRLEIYDEPPAPSSPDGEQAADDRIAEQFRREFMDAISSRQRRRPAPAPAAAGPGGKKDDRPKGPKLGGSRSARAAMREQQEKAAKR